MLLAFFFFVFNPISGQIRAIINQNGLNYIADLSKHLLEEQLIALKIPDQNVEIKGGEALFQNISIARLGLPLANFSLQNDGLLVQTEGGSAVGMLDFKTKGVVTVKGSADIEFEDMEGNFLFKWSGDGGTPTLNLSNCQAKMKKFSIKAKGNILLNMTRFYPLRKLIEKRLLDRINNEICPVISKTLETKINPMLANFPTIFPIKRKGEQLFSVEYDNLKSNIGNDFLEASASIGYISDRYRCKANALELIDNAPSTEHMLSLWITEKVPDCLLNIFHENGKFLYITNSSDQRLSTFLATSCPPAIIPECLGGVFPNLTSFYPNKVADVIVYSSFPPIFTIQNGRLLLQTFASVNISLEGKTLAILEVNITGKGTPRLENGTILGTLEIEASEIVLSHSSIGTPNSLLLEKAGPILVEGANTYLRRTLETGYIIPSLLGASISESSKISLFDGFLRLDLNIE